MLGWGEEQANLQARILSLRIWRSNENWPDVNDETLIKTIEQFYNGITPTVIIDSPNQQDQDPQNIDRIYNFIIKDVVGLWLH